MQSTSKVSNFSGKTLLRRLFPSLLLNIALPFAVYVLVKRYVTSSEIVALSVASLSPLVESLFSLLRHRSLNILSVIVLLSTGTGIVGALLSSNEDLILISGSFFTGAMGLACFVSLVFPRPLMFYLVRQFTAGRDPERLARVNAGWQQPYARFVHRLITMVWGGAFLGEFLIRVLLVLTLPHVLFVAIGPMLLTGITILTVLWTLFYARYAMQRSKQEHLSIQ